MHSRAHLVLVCVVGFPLLAIAEDAPAYRLGRGEQFSLQVVQETRPAQGPAFTRADLTYRFSVAESDAAGAKLEVRIEGRGVRGPDPESGYPEARAGRTVEYRDLGASFRIAPAGWPTRAAGAGRQVDATALDLRPAGRHEAGSAEHAMVMNLAQFFLPLSAGKVRSVVYGPSLFRLFPDDAPELTGLMWTEEPVEYEIAAPTRVRLGSLELTRVDFTAGFVKTTTHRGVDFSGTYRIVGFGLIDPAAGRPIAFKIDDAQSQYQIRVTGGGIVSRRIAEGRVRSANQGRTPIGLEACDPGYLDRVREYAGFRKLGSGKAAIAPAGPDAAPLARGEGEGLLGM